MGHNEEPSQSGVLWFLSADRRVCQVGWRTRHVGRLPSLWAHGHQGRLVRSCRGSSSFLLTSNFSWTLPPSGARESPQNLIAIEVPGWHDGFAGRRTLAPRPRSTPARRAFAIAGARVGKTPPIVRRPANQGATPSKQHSQSNVDLNSNRNWEHSRVQLTWEPTSKAWCTFPAVGMATGQ